MKKELKSKDTSTEDRFRKTEDLFRKVLLSEKMEVFLKKILASEKKKKDRDPKDTVVEDALRKILSAKKEKKKFKIKDVLTRTLIEKFPNVKKEDFIDIDSNNKKGQWYEILDNRRTLLISKRKVTLPCSISWNDVLAGFITNYFIVEKDNLIIVNFNPRSKEEVEELKILKKEQGLDMDRNIWALSREGDLVWIVERAIRRDECSHAYMSLFLENDHAVGGNWSGFDYIIDTSNGDVKALRETR